MPCLASIRVSHDDGSAEGYNGGVDGSDADSAAWAESRADVADVDRLGSRANMMRAALSASRSGHDGVTNGSDAACCVCRRSKFRRRRWYCGGVVDLGPICSFG